MSQVRNVLICSAGMGSRFGLGGPRCLSPVQGRPLIHWQLDLLDDIENVVVVVGQQASKVIAAVMARRPDAVFVINHDYEQSSILDSMMMGSVYFREPFIYMDDDILVTESTMQQMIESPCPSIGIRRTYSDDPICVHLGTGSSAGMVTGFTRDAVDFEWTGLAKLGPEHAKARIGEMYVYQALEHCLPLHAVQIDCVEIDTLHNQDETRAWARKTLSSGGMLKQAA